MTATLPGTQSRERPPGAHSTPRPAERLGDAEHARGEAGVALARRVPGDHRDSVVVLAAANLRPDHGLSSMLGMSFPFAAPLSPALATWASDEKLKLWTENSRHLIGRVDRPVLEPMRARVRERGYAVSLGRAMDEAFDVVVVNPETSRAELAALWTQVNDEYTALEGSEHWYAEVSSFQVPVFDADGNAVVELVVSGFGPGASWERFDAITGGALATAARLTESIGGRMPRE